MFKKVTVILFVLLLLSSCSLKNINLTEPESASFDSGNNNCPNTDDIIADEYRGVWINYNELSMKSVGGGTAEDFKNKIDTMFENNVTDKNTAGAIYCGNNEGKRFGGQWLLSA